MAPRERKRPVINMVAIASPNVVSRKLAKPISQALPAKMAFVGQDQGLMQPARVILPKGRAESCQPFCTVAFPNRITGAHLCPEML
jgi:hypothetical protein